LVFGVPNFTKGSTNKFHIHGNFTYQPSKMPHIACTSSDGMASLSCELFSQNLLIHSLNITRWMFKQRLRNTLALFLFKNYKKTVIILARFFFFTIPRNNHNHNLTYCFVCTGYVPFGQPQFFFFFLRLSHSVRVPLHHVLQRRCIVVHTVPRCLPCCVPNITEYIPSYSNGQPTEPTVGKNYSYNGNSGLMFGFLFYKRI
jgi:hypothetical protein